MTKEYYIIIDWTKSHVIVKNSSIQEYVDLGNLLPK